MTLRTHPAPMRRSTSRPPTAEPITVRSRRFRRMMWRTATMAWQAVARPPRAIHMPLRSHWSSPSSPTRTARRSADSSASRGVTTRPSEGGGNDGPDASELAGPDVDDPMRNRAVEADAVPGFQAVDLIAQVHLGSPVEEQAALLGGIGEELLPRRDADLVHAQDELDLAGEIGCEELVRDALAGRQRLPLAHADDDAIGHR